MVIYGKPYGDVAAIKANFVDENEVFLKNNDRIAAEYMKQPVRMACKICGSNLSEKNMRFHSHGVSYHVCNRCGHINGHFLETENFTTELYEESDYGQNYRGGGDRKHYRERMAGIYIPKAEFMLDCLRDVGEKTERLKFLDVGAGSGYFVGAMLDSGLEAAGIEVSASQVQYANDMLGKECIANVKQENVPELIRKTDAEVISFIGVLEHAVNLHEILRAVNSNNHIKYIFFSVPMFSYSVFFEAVNPDIFNRQLGGAHTHIFTDDSLNYIYKSNGWRVLGEWRFGTDAADLFRTLCVKLKKDGNDYLAEIFTRKFANILDDIQLVIDKQEFCSEIHVLAKKYGQKECAYRHHG